MNSCDLARRQENGEHLVGNYCAAWGIGHADHKLSHLPRLLVRRARASCLVRGTLAPEYTGISFHLQRTLRSPFPIPYCPIQCQSS
jgi:hypothetical protein